MIATTIINSINVKPCCTCFFMKTNSVVVYVDWMNRGALITVSFTLRNRRANPALLSVVVFKAA
jgi:hypothetical protein